MGLTCGALERGCCPSLLGDSGFKTFWILLHIGFLCHVLEDTFRHILKYECLGIYKVANQVSLYILCY